MCNLLSFKNKQTIGAIKIFFMRRRKHLFTIVAKSTNDSQQGNQFTGHSVIFVKMTMPSPNTDNYIPKR